MKELPCLLRTCHILAILLPLLRVHLSILIERFPVWFVEGAHNIFVPKLSAVFLDEHVMNFVAVVDGVHEPAFFHLLPQLLRKVVRQVRLSLKIIMEQLFKGLLRLLAVHRG